MNKMKWMKQIIGKEALLVENNCSKQNKILPAQDLMHKKDKVSKE